MKFSKKYFQLPLETLIESLENNKVTSPIAFDKMLIILYFSQPLGYFIFIKNQMEFSYSFLTLTQVLAYTNFVNFLNFVESRTISLIAYIFVITLICVPFFIIWIFFIHFSIFQRKKTHKTLLWVYFAKFLTHFSYFHYWACLLPMNDLFFNVFSQATFGNEFYLFENKTSSIPLYFYIISSFGVILNLSNALLTLWLYKSTNFLDISSLNFHFTGIHIVKLCFRVLFSFLIDFYFEIEILYHIHLHFWLFLHIYELNYEFPTRNTVLCKFYVSCLFSAELIVINFTLYRYTALLDQDSIFYTVFLMIAFGFKLGSKIYDVFYGKIVFQLILCNKKAIFFLEELFYFYDHIVYPKNVCFLYGLARNHTKHCNDELCIHFKRNIIDKNILKLKFSYLINRLILRKFSKLISCFAKNPYDQHNFTVKFLSYLSMANLNPVKCYYEAQKIVFKTNLENTSFFNKILLEMFQKKMKNKIKHLTSKQFSANSSEKEQTQQITPEVFFKIAKIRSIYEKHLDVLVNEKKNFWENYEKGISTIEEMLAMLSKIDKKINDFKLILEKQRRKSIKSRYYLLSLKYLSILHTVLLNSIHVGYKYEEEYELIILRAQTHQKEKILTNLSFLDPDIATCLVSFLNMEGNLKEESKTEKLAGFFGYSHFEFKLIKNLSPLMPGKIGIYHDDFVSNFLKKSKKKIQKTIPIIDSYAINKNGFIFPIRIFYGYHYGYQDDFVIMGALLKLSENNSKKWLFDSQGNTLGMSENFFEFLKTKYDFLQKNQMFFLNAIGLIPSMQNLINDANNDCSENKYKSFSLILQTAWLILPRRLKEILHVMASISKEETFVKKPSQTKTEQSKTFKSILTNKSNKSDKSNNTNFKLPKTFLNTLSAKESFFAECKDTNEIKKKIYEHFLSISTTDSTRLMIYFDFKYQKYIYGTEPDEFITVVEIDIKKIEEESATFLSRTLITSNRSEDPLFNENKSHERPQNQMKSRNFLTKSLEEQKSKELGDGQDYVISSQEFQMDIPDKIDFKIVGSTTNKLQEKEHPKTQRSSSVIGSKIGYIIFNSINKIQSLLPKSLYIFVCLLIFEAFMVLAYFTILFNLYSNYVGQSYGPIQSSLINFCRLATSLSYSTALYTEIEYKTYNITNRTLSDMKKNLWIRIMNDNFITLKTINYQERNQPGTIYYQTLYKNIENYLIDYETYQKKLAKYSDNMDFFSDLIYQTITGFDPESIYIDYQIIMQRNYPYVLPTTSTILLEVQNDFFQSNSGTTQTALAVMIAFLVLSVILKLFEIWQLFHFHKKITSLTNIFRRVSVQDAYNEKIFYSEISSALQKPYLRMSFFEKCTNKRKIDLEEEGQIVKINERNAAKKTKKKYKNSGFYEIKQIPKTKSIVFMSMLFSAGVLYYFFNYYFWIINNQNIDNLIQINVFFINVYVYSTTIMSMNTLALREKVVRNPNYEKINDIYQNHEERMQYFYDNLIERLNVIGNLTSLSLPTYTLEAQKAMNNQDFNQLIDDDICELLMRKNIVEKNELALCYNSFEESFKQGILSLFQSFIQEIKNLQGFTKFINNTEEMAIQAENVKDLIRSQRYEDDMFSYYYYHQTLLLYYDFINSYYQNVMDSQMNNLFIFVIITSIFAALGFLFLAAYMNTKLTKYYKGLTLILNTIPHEKIINDEQTKFLINSFLKNN